MRIKVGFTIMRHPDIDPRIPGTSEITLWAHTYNAPSATVAVFKAKRDVPVDEIEGEVKKRWPQSKFVGYTHQIKNKQAWVSWGRIISSISFDNLRRIQRGNLTVSETMITRRIK